LRLILDYNGVLENPLLIDLERQKRVTGDVLLTYLVHPGTALYAGLHRPAGELGIVTRRSADGGPNRFPIDHHGKTVFRQDQLSVPVLRATAL
jgi:hypothetical protein